MVTSRQLATAIAEGGWRPDVVERVLAMAEVLDDCARHPGLRDALALKGGTALNVFAFDMPRLSVDLDFNYVASIDRTQMLAGRTSIERTLEAIAAARSMECRMVRDGHAGAKWRLHGVASRRQSATVEIDINFQHRAPLWPIELRSAEVLGVVPVRRVPLLAHAEIVAGKLVALLDRTRARDIYDASLLLRQERPPSPDTRLAFFVYLALARTDWRELLSRPIEPDDQDFQRQLIPMLRASERPDDPQAWTRDLCTEVERLLEPLRTPTAGEQAFLSEIADAGSIDPSLLGLAADDPIAQQILASPALQWKAQHAREHARRSAGDD